MSSHSWPFWVPLTPQSANTAHNRQIVQKTPLKGKVTHTKQQGIRNTHRYFPEVPGSSEQRTLHCKELQDLFFVKSLLSRAEGIHVFLDTETDTEWQTQ